VREWYFGGKRVIMYRKKCIPFSTPRSPAPSSASCASLGKLVRTTLAAMVMGRSASLPSLGSSMSVVGSIVGDSGSAGCDADAERSGFVRSGTGDIER